LQDIPPAARGVPQIEVTFDIDANGILNVSAKDKATGKEQSIVVKASSGLSDSEIDDMIKDAEVHADEDKKFHELVTARNTAEGMIHATEKSLEDLGDQVEAEEKKSIEEAVAELKDAIKTDDKDDIESKTQKLTEISGKLAERVYAQGAGAAGAAEGASYDASGSADSGSTASSKDDVVDADFEEVKEEVKENK